MRILLPVLCFVAVFADEAAVCRPDPSVLTARDDALAKLDVLKGEVKLAEASLAECQTAKFSEATANTDLKTALTKAQQKTASLEKSIETLTNEKSAESGRVKQLEADLSALREQLANNADLVADREKLKASALKLESDLAEAKISLDTERKTHAEVLERELQSLKTSHLEEKNRMKSSFASESAAAKRKLSEIESELASLKETRTQYEVIYSKAQFVGTVKKIYRVGKAFTNLLTRRVKSVVGEDSMTLLSMQCRAWVMKMKDTTDKLYSPIHEKTTVLYNQYLSGPMSPINLAVKQHTGVLRNTLMGQTGTLKRWTNTYMDSIITNLSKVDPEISTIFPNEFSDKLMAFAMVMLCFYCLMEAASWLWTQCVVAPILIVARGTSSRSDKNVAYRRGSLKNKNKSTTQKTISKADKKK